MRAMISWSLCCFIEQLSQQEQEPIGPSLDIVVAGDQGRLDRAPCCVHAILYLRLGPQARHEVGGHGVPRSGISTTTSGGAAFCIRRRQVRRASASRRE
jgi:hypothetical protein